MADTYLTHFCLDMSNWGTMKSLEIKIASFWELFQNIFYLKDVRHELSSWSVRSSFENFGFTVSLTWRIITTKLFLPTV